MRLLALLGLFCATPLYAQCFPVIHPVTTWELVRMPDGRCVCVPVINSYIPPIQPQYEIGHIRQVDNIPAPTTPINAKKTVSVETEFILAVENLKKEVAALKRELEKLKEVPKLPDGPTTPLKEGR